MPASRSLPYISALAVSLVVTACAPIPHLTPAPTPRAPASIAASQSLAGTNAAWPGDDWWVSYGDPQLTALMDEGLRDSPDIAAAVARVRKAVGLAQQAHAALLPSLDATAQTGVTKQSYNNGFPKEFVPRGWLGTGQGALDFNFDLDLWGKNRASLAAATSETRAAEIDARQARLVLTTGIADAYADLARLFAERDIQQRTLELRIATRDLVAQRRENGLETQGSLREADAGVATARGNLAADDEAIALRRNQIAALIGAGPDRGLAIERPRPGAMAAQALPADVTTNLVARRPDIAAALARTEAEASRVKAARADFYPAIKLSALVGIQSLGFATAFVPPLAFTGGATPFVNKLFTKDSIYGNAGPAISLPIFHGGDLAGQYRGARATYDEAVADYDKTVLTAYREVADAVASRAMLTTRLADARAAQTASEEAYAIAKLRYEGGLSTYLDVLTVEDRLLTARETVADLETRAFTLDVALVRALGGGFTIADAASPKDDAHG
jgi:NodT family efflux transporter outer membrane factor (OMF) lipoprotein